MTDRSTRCARATAATITDVAGVRVRAHGRITLSGGAAMRPLALPALPGELVLLVLPRPSTA